MQNGWEYPSQMPEGTTPGASNREPGGRRTNVTTFRERPSGARGHGAVGSGGARRGPDMVATHGRDDFAEMPKRYGLDGRPFGRRLARSAYRGPDKKSRGGAGVRREGGRNTGRGHPTLGEPPALGVPVAALLE